MPVIDPKLKPATKWTVVRARFLLPMAGAEKIADGYVLTEDSSIKEVGKFSPEIEKRILKDFGSDLTVIGCKECSSPACCIPQIKGILMPGFVKAHGHDHESALIGIAKGVPLTDWLDQAVNPFTGFLDMKRKVLEEHFGKSPNLVAYMKARLDDLYYGITSSVVHHCNHNKYHVEELVQANLNAGTKMIVAVGSQDRHYDERILDKPASIAVDRLEKYWKEFDSVARTWVIPGPDQFFSNGPELLKLQKEAAKKKGCLIHCHSSEEPNTTKWFIETYGQTPVQYANSIGFLDKDTMLAHQVNNTDEDLRILKETGASVVHNSLANTILGSGMPPVVKMLEMGIPVAISTDGSGSADLQNILIAARVAVSYQRAALKNPRAIPEAQALEMITSVPAKMMRLNCGALAVGKDADLVVLDTRRTNMTPTHDGNVVENVLWASDGSEVRYVMSNGILVKDDYEFPLMNEGEILEEMEQLTMMFMEYLEKEHKEIKATGVRSK